MSDERHGAVHAPVFSRCASSAAYAASTARLAAVWRAVDFADSYFVAQASGAASSSSTTASCASAASTAFSSSVCLRWAFFEGPLGCGAGRGLLGGVSPCPFVDGAGAGGGGVPAALRSSRTRQYSGQPPTEECSVESSIATAREPTASSSARSWLTSSNDPG